MRRLVLCSLIVVGLAAGAGLAQKPPDGAPAGPPPDGLPQLDPRMPDLFLAVGRGDTAAIREIVKRGVDPDVRNILEFTPLMYAAAADRREAVEVLLEAGAKIDAPSPFGSALTIAEAAGHSRIAMLLLDRGAAAEAKRVDRIQPLMVAAWRGHSDVVRRLLEKGAAVDTRSVDGGTALSYAARGGSAAAARILLERGAAVDAADSRGWTPLMYAAANGYAAVAEALLERKASVSARESGGNTALILAASYSGNPDVARTLLAAGADRGAADRRGRTAGAIAAARGYREMAALLGHAGGPAEQPGRTPRQAAAAGLKLLESSQQIFLKKLGCGSCHHQALAMITTGLARDRGFSVSAALAREQVERNRGSFEAFAPFYTKALAQPELAKQVPFTEIDEGDTGDTFGLAGMAALRVPASPALSAAATLLARRQEADGRWNFVLQRVPMQSSDVTITALAIRSLQAYAPKTAAANPAARIAKAKSWLLTAPVRNSEDRAMRLVGLHWAGASPAEKAASVRAIRSDQRADGGWGQLDSLASDAYATGQALYALHAAGGVPFSDPAMRKGIAFLLRTQDEDGSWFVNKRAAPFNFYTDVGFPHGESQYASFAGTCWATMALILASGPEPRRTAGRAAAG